MMNPTSRMLMHDLDRRIIAHVDMDSFFTAVEVLDDPSLLGKAVIVGADPKGGRGRGVVSAASYEARRFGIHSAMPISRAFQLCPAGVFLPGRMGRYGEVSDQVMAILGGFTPQIEQVSVDEAFLDLSGCRKLLGNEEDMGKRIKATVREQTGLTASVGIGPNKLVAKIASDFRKPDGLVIVPQDQVTGFLEDLPTGRLWGVGPKTETELLKLGIRTIGALASVAPGLLERQFGDSGQYLHARARGIDDEPVGADREEKSVGRETTFDRDTQDRQLLARTLLAMCDEIAGRLRRLGLRGRTITLKLRYQGFETHTFRTTTPNALDETSGIYDRAKALLCSRGDPRRPVRLIGVSVSKFGESRQQTELFDRGDIIRGKRRTVELAVDEVRARYGRRALIRAGALDRDG
jgi:DNA polymerase IV